MRQYCEVALQYGEMPVMNDSRPRQITVILNPVANNRFVKMWNMHVYGVLLRILYLEVHTSLVLGCLDNDIFLLCYLTLAGSHFSIFFMSSSCYLEFLGD